MARTGWSTSNYLSASDAAATAPPLTMAAWGLVTGAVGTNMTIMTLTTATGGSGQDLHALQLDGSTSGRVRATSNDTGGAASAVATAAPSANTWFHAAGVWSATNSRAAFLNGGNKGTNTTSKTVPSSNRTAIGVNGIATPGQAFSSTGLLAEAAIWNAALTDAEIAVLATGVSPLAVRPGSLVAYWPLIGKNSPENNLRSGGTMAITGSLSAAAHPRIIMPPRQGIIV